jgi:GGDEF domain-containing protein
MRILFFEAFKDKYGFVAGDEVLRFSAMLISEIVDAKGSPEDFIGHAGGDNFVLITSLENAVIIKCEIEKRFNEEVQSHYSYIDREQGGTKIDDGMGSEKLVPLMRIVIGMISSEREFSDIREITEAAAEARRKAQQTTVAVKPEEKPEEKKEEKKPEKK